MRTREKLLVLLVAITGILGSIIYINFRNNELEANYFRWLFANNLKYGTFSPRQFIADELPAGSLLYGGLALFALVVLIVVLKMLRDGELQALRRRVMDIGAAKNQTESLLEEQVWQGKHERQAKDAVTRDLEASIDRIEHLIGDLNEKEKLVKVRENELGVLKSRVVEQSGVGAFNGPSDRGLRAELEKTRAGLQAKEGLIGEFENRLSAKTKIWESQLREKESLVKARDGELAGLHKEIKGLGDRLGEMETSRNRTERLLQDELREKKTVLEANELASRTEGKRLSEKIGALEHQVGDKDKLLRSRESEMETIRRQLGELRSAREELESRLHDEVGNADNNRRAVEALVKETEQKYAGSFRTLQNEIAEKDVLLLVRDDEMRAFKMEIRAAHLRLNEVTAAKERAEVALQQQLHHEQERSRESEVANKELADRYANDLESLHGRINEKQQTLQSRDGEMQLLEAQIASLNEQLHKAEIAKDSAAASLQDQIHKEQEIRHASDAAIRTVEDNFRVKINALEKQLSEKQEAAASSDTAELNGLRAELKAMNQRIGEMTAAAKENVESLYREALREKTELLLSKEIARKELEENFADKLGIFESQVREKTDIIQNREAELSAAKKQLAELNAGKDQTIHSLQAIVKQHAELLQSKETARQALESGSSEMIRSLEGQRKERDEMLASRDTELKAIGAKVGSLTAQLAEVGRAREQDTRLLREELRQKTDLLHVKVSAIKKIEERFSSQIRALEDQIGEKAGVLDRRDSEIDTLMAKVSALTEERAEIVSARDKSERLAQEELREKTVMLQAKESSIGELEEQWTAQVHLLEHQLAEKQKLLASGGDELSEQRRQTYLLTEKIGAVEGAKFRAETQLQEELIRRASEGRAQPEPGKDLMLRELNDEAHAADDLLQERDTVLKARDKLIQELMVELKEKKSQLARHEIEVWQGIERRDVWKHRLSKFGIRLKN